VSSALSHWTLPDKGALFVVCGPTGVGKSTLIRHAMRRIAGLEFSVSATTRPARAGEHDGQDYHFLAKGRFLELVEQGAFLEHAQVYDNFYGTLREPTETCMSEGASLILDIDVQGARAVRASMPDSVSVMILPPGAESLVERLTARGTDSQAVIDARMKQIVAQIEGAQDVDYVLTNDVLETAQTIFESILIAELSRRQRRRNLVKSVIEKLSG
jgi:guanylate kinase